MHWYKKAIIASFVVLAACSTKNRTATAQISKEELASLFNEMSASVVSATSNAGSIVQSLYRDDPFSTVFYAASDDARSDSSVLSLNDMSFISTQFAGQRVSILDVEESYVDVLFIDGVLSGEDRRFALMIQMRFASGQTISFTGVSESGDYQFSDEDFVTAIQGANGERVILRSSDVHKSFAGELGTSIKLEVWIEENGIEYYAGQISTMAGFGGL